MKKEYDLSKMKSRSNPYAKSLKKQVTLRMSPEEGITGRKPGHGAPGSAKPSGCGKRRLHGTRPRRPMAEK